MFGESEFAYLSIKFVIRRTFAADLAFASVVFASIIVGFSQGVRHVIERAVVTEFIF